jgi:deoxyribodipyrimidine photo-lyase
MGRSAEAFLDQVVTWRELGLNAAVHLPGYEAYASLPDWARRSLADHGADRRPYVYDLETHDAGQTHDPLWNAAQRQLREEGTIQNYLRMLWGKKVLEWSPTPEGAAEALIELNNRYALDGRDPNSYSGIYWCFGRYDRPWGPRRPVFGTVRYVSSANTARKLALEEYLNRFGS